MAIRQLLSDFLATDELPMTDSSFHPGELAVKEKTGETLVVMRNGKIIGDRIPNGAFKFVDKQPMVIATSFDAEQNIWTLLLAGKSGFVVAEDPLLISLNTNWLVSVLDDIFWRNVSI